MRQSSGSLPLAAEPTNAERQRPDGDGRAPRASELPRRCSGAAVGSSAVLDRVLCITHQESFWKNPTTPVMNPARKTILPTANTVSFEGAAPPHDSVDRLITR